MAETILDAGLAVSRFRKRYFTDYVRESRFRPYMGEESTNIIVTIRELESEAGKTINLPLVGALNGAGVSGSQMLAGNEEDLATFNMPISINWRRNGVVVPKSEQYKTEVDLLGAARPELKRWSANKLRADVIRAFGSIQVWTAGADADTPGTLVDYAYANASEANKDAWLAANADRVQFGALSSNNSSNDHSASLANIDTTADRATATTLRAFKRKIQNTTGRKIVPYMTDDGREFVVVFVGSRAFRDLENDADIKAADLAARAREGNGMEKNPIFQGGDLVYRGMIIREEPEITAIVGVGASSSDVEPIYMCGAQAIGMAWGQTPAFKTDRDRDYQFRPAVGIEELLGVRKIAFEGVQRGVGTLYVSAPADA